MSFSTSTMAKLSNQQRLLLERFHPKFDSKGQLSRDQFQGIISKYLFSSRGTRKTRRRNVQTLRSAFRDYDFRPEESSKSKSEEIQQPKKQHSFSEIFQVEKWISPEKGRLEWKSTRMIQNWNAKRIDNFECLLRRHKSAEKFIKSREERISEHKNNISKIEERFALEPGEIIEMEEKQTRRKLIMKEWENIKICENAVANFQKKLTKLESLMYCELTNRAAINKK